jgi:HSP20 family protein
MTKYELIPFSAFRPLSLRERGWDELVERFFTGSLVPVEGAERDFVPSVDIRETEEGYELTAEVPGLKPEEIEVTLSGDVLILKGEKKEEHEADEGGYHLVERRFGSFYRSFRLAEPVDREHLAATHKDGVLRVRLPKVVAEKTTKVEVKPN